LRIFPGLEDPELDGRVAVAKAVPRRRLADLLPRIARPLALAVVPTTGFVWGLELHTDISPLKRGMIRVLGGFLFVYLLTVWSTSGE
jgi:hypothetical protein